MKFTPVLLSEQRFGSGHYPYNGTQCPDGRIIVSVGPRPGEKPYWLYSEDGGLSFEKKEGLARAAHAPFIRLKNGKYFSIGFDNAVFRSILNPSQEKIPFMLAIHKAESFDDIMNGNVNTHFSNVDIPSLSQGFGDSNNRFAGCAQTGLIELSNGDILAMMYGQFKEDRTLCPWLKEHGPYDFYLYRTWCIISHDGGESFEFLSTVADCNAYPIKDVNGEGYCETDCIEIENGHIVAVLRTGGHEIYSPLYIAHSHDYGKTWEAPYEICDWGVLPRIIKMSDGTLVISSGHIHTMLLFSEDNGKTWSEPCILEECDGKWGESCSGYNFITESRPGELTIVFDDPKEGIAEKDSFPRRVYIRRYAIKKA
ncbi:MAG: exo-alpha-sialidase [Ruminococcaceae bacterium]|nr:exo-alpha-sialidase [Oscillospiraceae bacterium]